MGAGWQHRKGVGTTVNRDAAREAFERGLQHFSAEPNGTKRLMALQRRIRVQLVQLDRDGDTDADADLGPPDADANGGPPDEGPPPDADADADEGPPSE